MARPANPNKEKIAALKIDLKEVSKVVRSGETAAKKKEKIEDKLAKLTGDAPAATVKTAKVGKTAKTEKVSKSEKAPKSSKKDKEKDSTKAKLQVVKKRGRPRKSDEDED